MTQDSRRSFILSETPVEQMAQSCSTPVPAEGKARGAHMQAGSAAAAGAGLLQLGFEHLPPSLWTFPSVPFPPLQFAAIPKQISVLQAVR